VLSPHNKEEIKRGFKAKKNALVPQYLTLFLANAYRSACIAVQEGSYEEAKLIAYCIFDIFNSIRVRNIDPDKVKIPTISNDKDSYLMEKPSNLGELEKYAERYLINYNISSNQLFEQKQKLIHKELSL
jgi:hypothetical protein